MAAVVIAVAGLGVLADGEGGGVPLTAGKGRAAPDFALPELRRPQSVVNLSAYRGRPVVLNFWASWCVPCRREMPTFEAVSQQIGKRVAFLGINHQDGRSAALALVEETGVTYPSGYDPEGRVALDYRLIGMPTTVFISPAGQILATRTGEMTRSELRQAIAELFDQG